MSFEELDDGGLSTLYTVVVPFVSVTAKVYVPFVFIIVAVVPFGP